MYVYVYVDMKGWCFVEDEKKRTRRKNGLLIGAVT